IGTIERRGRACFVGPLSAPQIDSSRVEVELLIVRPKADHVGPLLELAHVDSLLPFGPFGGTVVVDLLCDILLADVYSRVFLVEVDDNAMPPPLLLSGGLGLLLLGDRALHTITGERKDADQQQKQYLPHGILLY